MAFILLTGMPAMGKTTIGDYLMDNHGYTHLDFEETTARGEYLLKGDLNLKTSIMNLMQKTSNIVITWGFQPNETFSEIFLLRNLGFEWFWFDGNREHAYKQYLIRSNKYCSGDLECMENAIYAWREQLKRIKAYVDPNLVELSPTIINTYDSDGNFIDKVNITKQLVG